MKGRLEVCCKSLSLGRTNFVIVSQTYCETEVDIFSEELTLLDPLAKQCLTKFSALFFAHRVSYTMLITNAVNNICKL